MLRTGDAAPALQVQPVFGTQIRLPPKPEQGDIVLLLVRRLGCPFAKESLALAQQWFAEFDRLGVTVLAITQSGVKLAQDFVPRHQLLFPLVTDPEGSVHERYEIEHVGMEKALIGALAKRGPHGLLNVVMAHGWLPGTDVQNRAHGQLPAEFLVSREGELRYVHYADSIADMPDMEAMLACAKKSSRAR
jgi:peroxiredoxin